MNEDTIREREFTGAMLDIFRRTFNETGYRAAWFFNMINEQGGVQAARALITAAHPSDGYTALQQLNRLDLTVEALVLRPEWRDIFPDDVRIATHSRLNQYEFHFPADSWHPST